MNKTIIKIYNLTNKKKYLVKLNQKVTDAIG